MQQIQANFDAGNHNLKTTREWFNENILYILELTPTAITLGDKKEKVINVGKTGNNNSVRVAGAAQSPVDNIHKTQTRDKIAAIAIFIQGGETKFRKQSMRNMHSYVKSIENDQIIEINTFTRRLLFL